MDNHFLNLFIVAMQAFAAVTPALVQFGNEQAAFTVESGFEATTSTNSVK